MKKILIIALAVVMIAACTCVFVGCSKEDTSKIVMYTESGFAPYEFVDANNNIIGVDVAIMSEAAERLGKKLEIKDVSFDFITKYVADSNGYSVGAAGLTINDERKQSVDFSHVYASSTLVIISKTENAFDYVSDLAGKKVGVQQGTSGDLIISDAATADGYVYEVEGDTEEETEEIVVKAAGAEVKKYSTYALAYEELKNGRIDAILMDKLPAQSLLATQGSNNLVINDAVDLISEDFGVALKKGADKALADKINEVIDEWLENGNLAKYTDYYTALDDYEKNGGTAPVAPAGLKLTWNV